MKKMSLFFLITMVLIVYILTGCAKKDKSDIVKESFDLQEISITLYNKKCINVTESEKMQDIVKVINDTTSKKEESTQDVPDVDKYGKIVLMSKENEKTLYYYEKKDKYYIEEPYVKVQVITPNEFVGTLMDLSQSKRGIFKNMTYLDKVRVDLTYEIPLSEVITDFYDQLKSRTKGYASLDYEFCEYKRSNLVKLDIMLAGEVVDALSVICHEDSAFYVGQKLTAKLKDIIPRQLFEVPIQAAVGGRIIARTNIKAMRKNVLAKCYGGDISRKRKLLEKQKKGKKRMKSVGSVEVPQEAFMAVLSLDED